MRDDPARLRDVLAAADAIARHTAGGRDAFEADEVVQAAVIHNLVIIGEAMSKVSPQLQAAHPDVAWQEAVRLRNLLIHRYHKIDLRLVWTTVESDVPNLARDVGRVAEAAGFECDDE